MEYTDYKIVHSEDVGEKQMKKVMLVFGTRPEAIKMCPLVNELKTRKELESLPGVGRKTTNVVLSVGFDEPAFAVDTHVERISKRLGFAKKDDTVQDVERKVCRSIERSRWNKAHHQFIFFGRYFCKAQNPNCKECHLYDMCKEKRK